MFAQRRDQGLICPLAVGVGLFGDGEGGGEAAFFDCFTAFGGYRLGIIEGDGRRGRDKGTEGLG